VFSELTCNIDPEIVKAGTSDFWAGVHISDNPYDEGMERTNFESWLRGWIIGHGENGWFASPNLKPKKQPDFYSGKGE